MNVEATQSFISRDMFSEGPIFPIGCCLWFVCLQHMSLNLQILICFANQDIDTTPVLVDKVDRALTGKFREKHLTTIHCLGIPYPPPSDSTETPERTPLEEWTGSINSGQLGELPAVSLRECISGGQSTAIAQTVSFSEGIEPQPGIRTNFPCALRDRRTWLS